MGQTYGGCADFYNLISIDKNDDYLQLTRKVWFQEGGGEGVCTDPQTPMLFILPHAPHNFIFLCKVKALHLSRLTMLPHFLRDFVIHGDNGHIQGPAPSVISSTQFPLLPSFLPTSPPPTSCLFWSTGLVQPLF